MVGRYGNTGTGVGLSKDSSVGGDEDVSTVRNGISISHKLGTERLSETYIPNNDIGMVTCDPVAEMAVGLTKRGAPVLRKTTQSEAAAPV